MTDARIGYPSPDDTPRTTNLAHLLRRTARHLGERPALMQGEDHRTWGELDAEVDALAAGLQARGLQRGDRVLVHSPNRIEMVTAMFAIMRAGGVYVPVNVRSTPADVAVLAEICQPRMQLCHVVDPAPAAAVTDTVTVESSLWIGGDATDKQSVRHLIEHHRGSSPAEPPCRRGDPAWFFFTSGTTGRPKAAVLTHDQMAFVVTNHLTDLMPDLDEHDASLVVAPLSHGAGIHLLVQVARGARSVLLPSDRFDVEYACRLIERERITNLFTVPTILNLLVACPVMEQVDRSSLRQVIYAGAPMYRADQERAMDVLGEVLVQYYGLGEVTGAITVLPPHLHDRPVPEGMEIGTCGIERTGMQVSIQDDAGTELAPGESGEICVSGPAVCAGYFEAPEANADAFRDGWFRTGDIGLIDEEGFVYITGRRSDMYISGGSNIHPREIEEKLLRHPELQEAAVLGVPDPRWGEVGMAICVREPGSTLEEEELLLWLREHIAAYKVPKRTVFWDALPRSGYGKVTKNLLRQELEQRGQLDGAGDRAVTS